MTTNICYLWVRGALYCALSILFNSPVTAQDTDTKATQVQPQTESTENGEITQEDEYPLATLPPLRRIVLYNSGVGQLQHNGQVEDKKRFEIKFSAHDVDDVLKSLVFADQGGGTVRAVEYQPAPEPEDVAGNTVGIPMTLAQLIQRFRGEAISLTVDGHDVRGIVYGVENRQRDDELVETIVLLSDDGLRSVELRTAERVRFDKPELRTTLNQAMRGIVKSRKANQKTLELLFDGAGKRDIKFAYVVDMPIWRMTYRLSIKEDRVYLQGWAHVDNVTGVDWEQVTLELRSGKPQSFHINIFTPLMAERPDFGNGVYEFTQGLFLVSQWFGFDTPQRFGNSGGMGGGGIGGGSFGGGGGGGHAFSAGGSGRSRAAAGVDIESAFRQAARESRTAQLVRYELDKPVDLGAGRSAALPVFASEVPAKLISVFDEFDESATPFRAIEIENATPFSIVSGPVSIVRDGDFVGDGKFGRLDVDEKTEVIYGLDRAVEVQVTQSARTKRLLSIGLDARKIVSKFETTSKRTFRVNNRDTEQREMILYCQGPADEIEQLIPAPERIEDGKARYDLNAKARSVQEFDVTYRSQSEERNSLTGTNARLALQNDSDVAKDDDVRVLLEQLVDLDVQKNAARERLKSLAEKRNSLGREQERVRGNVKILTANSEAVKPFLAKLQSIEEQIEQVDTNSGEIKAELLRFAVQQDKLMDDYFATK